MQWRNENISKCSPLAALSWNFQMFSLLLALSFHFGWFLTGLFVDGADTSADLIHLAVVCSFWPERGNFYVSCVSHRPSAPAAGGGYLGREQPHPPQSTIKARGRLQWGIKGLPWRRGRCQFNCNWEQEFWTGNIRMIRRSIGWTVADEMSSCPPLFHSFLPPPPCPCCCSVI